MNTLTSDILLCPGQGAQHIGMGKLWAEKSSAAAKVLTEANRILGFDLAALCFTGPQEQLNRTDVSQPALFACGVACFHALREQEVLGELPGATAGLSLGEFTALHLAGAMSFEDGLKLVRLRGQAMQQAAEKNGGSMVALTGDVTEAKVTELCDQARGSGILQAANYNSPMQVVVTGTTDACERAVTVANEMGLKPTPLAVAGAFHSPLMRDAAEQLDAALQRTPMQPPRCTVMSNVTGEAHGSDVATIKRLLVEQLTSAVRWEHNCRWLVGNVTGRYIELAPGKVLSGLMRRIDRNTKVENFAEPG